MISKTNSSRPRWEEIDFETEFETETNSPRQQTKRLITHPRGEKQLGARSPVPGESVNSHPPHPYCNTCDQSPVPGEPVNSHPPLHCNTCDQSPVSGESVGQWASGCEMFTAPHRRHVAEQSSTAQCSLLLDYRQHLLQSGW